MVSFFQRGNVSSCVALEPPDFGLHLDLLLAAPAPPPHAAPDSVDPLADPASLLLPRSSAHSSSPRCFEGRFAVSRSFSRGSGVSGSRNHLGALSVSPPRAVQYFFGFLGYAATFLLVRDLALQFRSPWIPAIPLIVIGGLEAGLGMFQVFVAWPSGTAIGTYVNWDHYAGLLEVIFPVAALYPLAILREARPRFTSPVRPAITACLLWAVAAILFLAIAYSLSRMGFLSTVVSVFFVSVLTAGPRLPSRAWRWSSLGIIAAVVLLICVFLPPDQLIGRFVQLSSTQNVSADTRLLIWKQTLPLISEYRVFGCGLGGFASTFLRHQSVASNLSIDFAHNDYLQYLVELGFVGFAILTALLVGVLVQILRGVVKLQNESRRLLAMLARARS